MATGITDVNSPWAVNNNGTFSVQSGTLNLNIGGTSDGSFTAISGATLNFGGGRARSDGYFQRHRRWNHRLYRWHGRYRRHLQRHGHHVDQRRHGQFQ